MAERKIYLVRLWLGNNFYDCKCYKNEEEALEFISDINGRGFCIMTISDKADIKIWEAQG